MNESDDRNESDETVARGLPKAVAAAKLASVVKWGDTDWEGFARPLFGDSIPRLREDLRLKDKVARTRELATAIRKHTIRQLEEDLRLKDTHASTAYRKKAVAFWDFQLSDWGEVRIKYPKRTAAVEYVRERASKARHDGVKGDMKMYDVRTVERQLKNRKLE